MTLVPDLLRKTAQRCPDRIAWVVQGGGEMSYGVWDARSNCLARALVDRGLIPGARVGLFFDNAQGLPVGDPLDPSTMLGPLNRPAQLDRVQGYIQAGRDEGLELALEGSVPDGLAEQGSFVAPHIFSNVTPESRLWREEIFGPVLCASPFDTEEEAIALANDTEYGLGAGIWTRDLGRAHRIARKVRAGNIWVNTYGLLPVTAPFGGVKQSGWGREGGRDVLRDYTYTKNVLMEVGS